MPRFDLKTLFWSTSLIAVGLGLIVFAFPILRNHDHSWWFVGLWASLLGAVAIGRGIAILFNQASMGALLSFAIIVGLVWAL